MYVNPNTLQTESGGLIQSRKTNDPNSVGEWTTQIWRSFMGGISKKERSENWTVDADETT